MRTLFLNGTVGSGKSSVAEEISELFVFSDVAHGVIDLDALRRGWPAPEGDPFNTSLERRNLAAVAANFAHAGAQVLVVAGVIEAAEDLAEYRAILGADLWLCRLTVEPGEGHRRLEARHAASASELDWHRARAGELAEILEEAALEHAVVDTTGASIVAIAADVVTRFRATF